MSKIPEVGDRVQLLDRSEVKFGQVLSISAASYRAKRPFQVQLSGRGADAFWFAADELLSVGKDET